MSKLEKLIKFFARRRTFFILIAPVVMLVVAKPTIQGIVAGLLLIAVGQAIRFWASGFIVKDAVLASNGPFAAVRNPLYVGSLLIACGYSAMTGGWIVWAVVIPIFMILHWSAVYCEEKYLESKFGSEYEEYRRRVPRWMPRISRKVFEGDVSVKQIVKNNEHKNFFWTFVVVLLFVLKFMFWKQ